MKDKSNSTFIIGDIKAGPGECKRDYIKIGKGADHQDFHIPVIIFNGKRKGPTVYIQAASDGNELNGVAVLHHIIKVLDPAKINGMVIAVPIVNIHAFLSRTASSPIDNKKMNRCFPGKLHGSSSERIAHFLFHNAAIHADYCIDLHQHGMNPMIDECVVRVNKNERTGLASLELARVFGIGFINHEKGPAGQLAREAPARGIPTIDPELGGCRGWDNKSIQKGIRGILNVLKYYRLIEGKPEIPKQQIVARKVVPAYTDTGGFILFRKHLYNRVGKGEIIAEILNSFGDKVGQVKSPVEGVLWLHTPCPMAATGEHIASIGTSIIYI